MNQHDTETVTDVTPITASPSDSALPLATSTSRQVAVTPDDLLSMAVQSGANMDMLERLMALKERADANNAHRAFVEAMAAFKAEPLDIFKRKTVEFTTRDGDTTRYQHAELSDVAEVVVPAMARHGLSHRWDVRQEGGRIFVTCVVTHRMGHSESIVMDAAPDDSGKKNNIQRVASAVTYLQRYTLLAACGLATKSVHDDDGAGTSGSDDDDPDQAMLQELLEQVRTKTTHDAAIAFYTANVAKFKGKVHLQSAFKRGVMEHRSTLGLVSAPKTEGAAA